jgi:Skp family chaperone for outer membrane proteins
MTQKATFVDEGRERVQAAFQNVEGEFQKIQKDFEARTKKLNKQAGKRVKKFQKEIRKNTVVKRAEAWRKDVNKQINTQTKRFEKNVESGLQTVLGTFQIASRGEVDKLDKKLNRINLRLKALDNTLSGNLKGRPSKSATAQAK